MKTNVMRNVIYFVTSLAIGVYMSVFIQRNEKMCDGFEAICKEPVNFMFMIGFTVLAMAAFSVIAISANILKSNGSTEKSKDSGKVRIDVTFVFIECLVAFVLLAAGFFTLMPLM